jgi:hypothetical protein
MEENKQKKRTTSSSVVRRSSRRRRRRKQKERRSHRLAAWLRAYGLDLLISLLILMGLALFFNAPRLLAGPDRFQASLGNWLAFGNGAEQLGIFFLVVALLAGSWRLRWRILHHQSWWARQCPECGANALKRTHRRWYDRLWEWVGVPMRRYICVECRWRGMRIDERRIR